MKKLFLIPYICSYNASIAQAEDTLRRTYQELVEANAAKEGELLTTELRIFALIKLGVNQHSNTLSLSKVTQ